MDLNDVKKLLAEINDAKKDLEGLREKIRDAKCEKANIEQEIENLKESVKWINKYDMPRSYVESFVRDATKNFAPGDKVWVLMLKNQNKECPDCKGDEIVDAVINGSNVRIKCPTCNGFGRIIESNYVIEEKTVKEVDLTLCFESDRVNYWSTNCITLAGCDSKVPVDNIFADREEAISRMREIGEAKKE